MITDSKNITQVGVDAPIYNPNTFWGVVAASVATLLIAQWVARKLKWGKR